MAVLQYGIIPLLAALKADHHGFILNGYVLRTHSLKCCALLLQWRNSMEGCGGRAWGVSTVEQRWGGALEGAREHARGRSRLRERRWRRWQRGRRGGAGRGGAWAARGVVWLEGGGSGGWQ